MRFFRREREAAERWGRLLMEVRERSWGGKWVGEEGVMGQLRRWRVRRVERDLRAVEEREWWMEVEQFVSWREVRCRKGVEVSQRKEVGWEHGSFGLGMLRDWRAFTCFGSRGRDSTTERVVVGRRKRRMVMSD